MGKRLHGVTLHLVDSFDEVENFLRWLSEDRGREWLACDLETEGLDWWRHRIRTIQFGDTRDGWTIPLDRWGGLADEVFKRVPPNGRVRHVAHNQKFDFEFLLHNEFDPPPFDCSMAMSYLTEPDRAKGLKPASARHVDPRAYAAQAALDLANKKQKWGWATTPWRFPPYWQYAAFDVVLTANLAADRWPLVERDYLDAYRLQLESDMVLAKMEMRGMRVDLPYCHEQRDRLLARFVELVEWFEREHGVDVMSPRQLVKFFWEQGIEIPLTTEKGAPSVKKESLEMIDHPLVDLILEARSCNKMGETYFGNLIEFADDDGLLHPNINPIGAITGRQSITRPALQTLPRTPLVRNAFVPRDGNKLVVADWQGQEMRVFAAFCRDPQMWAAYSRGEDLHDFAAERLFGRGFTKEQRQVTKNAGFAKIYGAGIAKFAATAGISEAEAKNFLDMYDGLFTRAKPFQAQVVQVIMQRAHEEESDSGYVTTLAGRRLPVPKKKAYKGVNYLVQGSCSDILRRALVDLDNAGLTDFGDDGGVILPVHDELAFDVPEAYATNEDSEFIHSVVEVMQQAKLSLTIPMIVEHDVLDRWGDKYVEVPNDTRDSVVALSELTS